MNLEPDILCLRFKKQLNNLLPGSASHFKMLPPGRMLVLPDENKNYHDSAVLVLLFPFQQQIQLCLIRRPSTMKNHAGQIAFPGGKREPEDADLIQTALREAQEEIGIAQGDVEILGLLSTVYVQISEFLITPVVGWLNDVPEVVVDKSEVDEVIFISLEDIANQGNGCEREMDTRTGRINVPGYEINGIFIWGATAMMLSELVDLYLDESQL
ncbi:MAG: CoA pyrophosphatase [Prolixibacteraceae bacterium]